MTLTVSGLTVLFVVFYFFLKRVFYQGRLHPKMSFSEIWKFVKPDTGPTLKFGGSLFFSPNIANETI